MELPTRQVSQPAYPNKQASKSTLTNKQVSPLP